MSNEAEEEPPVARVASLPRRKVNEALEKKLDIKREQRLPIGSNELDTWSLRVKNPISSAASTSSGASSSPSLFCLPVYNFFMSTGGGIVEGRGG